MSSSSKLLPTHLASKSCENLLCLQHYCFSKISLSPKKWCYPSTINAHSLVELCANWMYFWCMSHTYIHKMCKILCTNLIKYFCLRASWRKGVWTWHYSRSGRRITNGRERFSGKQLKRKQSTEIKNMAGKSTKSENFWLKGSRSRH